jgi:ribonuclease HI
VVVLPFRSSTKQSDCFHIRMVAGVLLAALSSFIVILLQFDGSYRPPRDPAFHTLESRIASCASIILIPEEAGCTKKTTLLHATDGHVRSLPFAVGGRSLPSEIGMTSAHVEYEGLLLGLEWLCEQEKLPLGDSSDETPILIIQGDCKTVIDQLTGRSTPRKLRIPHERAMNRIEQLKRERGTEVRYEHIPRGKNSICDGVGGTIMNMRAWMAMQDVWAELHNVGMTETPPKPSSSISSLGCILSKYFQSLPSLIRYSSRPRIYKKIATLSELSNDFETMRKVGEMLAGEAKLWPEPSANRYLALGIRYQIRGLLGLRREKESSQMQRRHRVLLERTYEETKEDDDNPAIMALKNCPSFEHSPPTEWKSLLEQWFEQGVELQWKDGTTLWVDSSGGR